MKAHSSSSDVLPGYAPWSHLDGRQHALFTEHYCAFALYYRQKLVSLCSRYIRGTCAEIWYFGGRFVFSHFEQREVQRVSAEAQAANAKANASRPAVLARVRNSHSRFL